MTQEDKELLLQDLCGRLPYMPKMKIIYQQQGIKGTDEGNVSCDAIEHIVNDLRNGVITDMQIYLRPMSSMTEEEKEELKTLFDAEEITSDSICYLEGGTLEEYLSRISFSFCSEIIDWLNAHHFDYRGLIPLGLAIEVTEENNPYKD